MANGSQGFYSIVQYSEFPERLEFVNVGVVLFADENPRVFFRFAKSSRRVERAFGGISGSNFFALLRSLESRLKLDFPGKWNRDGVDKFIGLRTGRLRLSPVRSVLVTNASEQVDLLFKNLVGDIPKNNRSVKASVKLKREFVLRGVEHFLERPEPVVLRQGVTIKAPYGYQNGTYNMINGVSLRDEPDIAIAKASTHAIEGAWLYEETATYSRRRLVVVADVEGQKPAFVEAVRDVMHSHSVKFYSLNDIDPLVADIRRHVGSQ